MRAARAVVFVAVLLLAAAWIYLLAAPDNPPAEPSRCADPVAGCTIPGSAVRVHFDHPPQSLQRFNLVVDWPQARAVHASFSMQGMEMGLNRYRLLAQGQGRWAAEVILPACVHGRSDWVVQLESGDERYALAFSAQ